jgi:hypothetical protein
MQPEFSLKNAQGTVHYRQVIAPVIQIGWIKLCANTGPSFEAYQHGNMPPTLSLLEITGMIQQHGYGTV